jgi:hypothetical protein
MLGLWPFNVGGIFSGLLMKLDFKSWRIGFIFDIFVLCNGEGL